MKRRPYEELQSIVEQEGGEMVFERAGHGQGGAWLGILPAANSRLIRIQSAASQPMTSRRLAGRANMDPMLTDKKSSVGDLSRSPTRCF